MTVDQEIAHLLLSPAEIKSLESVSNVIPNNSFDVDSYRVVLLRYAERIMFSPWMNEAKSPLRMEDIDISDRSLAELSKIREEIEWIDRKSIKTPRLNNTRRWANF